MATLAEFHRFDTDLTSRQLLHLQRLVQWWRLLADLSFSDLLLFAPARSGDKLQVVGQVRPTTAQTLYRDDYVGRFTDEIERPLVARSLRTGETVEGELTLVGEQRRARVSCVPVRHEGAVVAVLSRESAPRTGRTHGELETVYLGVFKGIARMISDGRFPFRTEDLDPEDLPRVADGVLVLDEAASIVYASPNALSTLHRIGVFGEVTGKQLRELGLEQTVVRNAMRNAVPTSGEVERHDEGGDVVVQLVAVPLIERLKVSRGVVLMRDVSDLRRRDRLLMSKDATIREIHHRVKNNLQTISALLRLQARRVTNEEARQAISESVRRIQAIAVVHENLSREVGEDVELADVLSELVRMVDDSLTSPERPIRFTVEGQVGIVPAAVVTPLSVVCNELLQNVVDHAYPASRPVGENGFVGHVQLRLELDADRLVMRVLDDGRGLPPGFELDTARGLGMSIVHTLVTTEMSGTIEMRNRIDGHGTEVVVSVPVDAGRAE